MQTVFDCFLSNNPLLDAHMVKVLKVLIRSMRLRKLVNTLTVFVQVALQKICFMTVKELITPADIIQRFNCCVLHFYSTLSWIAEIPGGLKVTLCFSWLSAGGCCGRYANSLVV